MTQEEKEKLEHFKNFLFDSFMDFGLYANNCKTVSDITFYAMVFITSFKVFKEYCEDYGKSFNVKQEIIEEELVKLVKEEMKSLGQNVK